MLRAAGEFDSDIPIAATYIRKAASQVETVSDAILGGARENVRLGDQQTYNHVAENHQCAWNFSGHIFQF